MPIPQTLTFYRKLAGTRCPAGETAGSFGLMALAFFYGKSAHSRFAVGKAARHAVRNGGPTSPSRPKGPCNYPSTLAEGRIRGLPPQLNTHGGSPRGVFHGDGPHGTLQLARFWPYQKSLAFAGARSCGGKSGWGGLVGVSRKSRPTLRSNPHPVDLFSGSMDPLMTRGQPTCAKLAKFTGPQIPLVQRWMNWNLARKTPGGRLPLSADLLFGSS